MKEIQAREGVYELEKGFNFVLKEVAKTILEQYYQQEGSWSETRLQLLAIERKLQANVVVSYENEVLPIRLTGRIDRLDRMGNTYRIIDYKTGKVVKKDLTVSDLGLMDTLTSSNLKAKLLQLWFYKFLFVAEMKQPSEENVDLFVGLSPQQISIQPGIISFRNLADQVMHEPGGLWFSEGQNLDAFKTDSEALISTWVHRILDPEQAFEKTKDITHCQFCDFKVICHREV